MALRRRGISTRVRAHSNPYVVRMTASLNVHALASQVGVSPHTLRYYKRAGLMIPVPRDSAGRRIYAPEHVRWVTFLLRLRACGMGIAPIREYVRLLQSNQDPEGTALHEILRAHRDEVRTKIRRLTDHLTILNQKIARGCSPATP